MKPARIYRGDTWERTWIIKDSEGSPIDLTDASARLYLRDSSGAVLSDYSNGDGITITGPEGRIDLSAPYADTETLDPGFYSFDIEVTNAVGVRKTYEKNTLEVLADTTYG